MSEAVTATLLRHLTVLQESLPLTEAPFAPYAEKLGITEDDVLALLRHYLSTGTVRRVAGLLKHNRAGFIVNAMVVLDVEAQRCDAAGEALARFPFISHCYQRTAYPDWPYTIYAMVHARSREEFATCLEKIRSAVTCRSLEVLRSLKEYKKTTFRIPGEQGMPV